MNLPVFQRLTNAKTVLLAGAGGGYDLFAGLPLLRWLLQSGKRVHLANLTFSELAYADAKRPVPALACITPESQGVGTYCPELHLCHWLSDQFGPMPIHLIERTGGGPTLESISGSGAREFWDGVLEFTPESRVRHTIALARTIPFECPPESAANTLGNGSEVTAPDTVPYALWCSARHGDDFAAALAAAIQTGGDTGGLADRPRTAGCCMISKHDRVLGGLWGAAVGDALGVPVEFKARPVVQSDPVNDLRGFGTHRQPPGTWSDDTSLSLCTAESLVEHEFDVEDMGRRFVRWYRDDHWTPHGDVFDIGGTTSTALSRIEQGTAAEAAGGRDEHSNGNGSLMRILPVALRFEAEPAGSLMNRAHRVSAITHAHERSLMCCGLYCLVVRALLAGLAPDKALQQALDIFRRHYDVAPWKAQFPPLRRVLAGTLDALPEAELVSSGYVVHTLEAALWCLLNTSSFESCVLQAVNLGGDSDTTGCVAGGLAGAHYGVQAVRLDWRQRLARRDDLERLFAAFARGR